MLTPALSVLYLHGFASSPQSRKARFLAERFGERGIRFNAPGLEEGDFFHLTISRQLKVVRAAARDAEGLIIIGSSLGGYLASLYAAAHSGVDRLILLAPAFGFHDLWTKRLGTQEIRNWRESGRLSVFHYATGGQADLSYEFLQDAEKYPPYPTSQVPTLIFHGTHDDLVPVSNSARFVDEHSNAQLVKLDSGHELTDVLDTIWARIQDVLPPG